MSLSLQCRKLMKARAYLICFYTWIFFEGLFKSEHEQLYIISHIFSGFQITFSTNKIYVRIYPGLPYFMIGCHFSFWYCYLLKIAFWSQLTFHDWMSFLFVILLSTEDSIWSQLIFLDRTSTQESTWSQLTFQDWMSFLFVISPEDSIWPHISWLDFISLSDVAIYWR